MKVVLSGKSCSGKTDLINALSSLGYCTVQETARRLIREGLSEGSDLLPLKNFYGFELKLIREQINESKNQERIVFFDRGVFDSLAYLYYKGYSLPYDLKRDLCKVHYDKVFFLEPVKNYFADAERWEDKKTSDEIGGLIRIVYADYGYELMDLPLFSLNKKESIEKRLKAVIQSVRD
jgi:predicted ATPase